MFRVRNRARVRTPNFRSQRWWSRTGAVDDPPEAPLDTADPGFLGYVCLGSDAGRAHARQLLETLVAKTHCEWIKIDFNLDPKAGCSCTDHGHGAGDGLYAHYRGLYALYDDFRSAHPEVIVEACASGGLRVDAGLLRHVHCAFLSDPDWVPHHLATVHGNSYLLPPAAMRLRTRSANSAAPLIPVSGIMIRNSSPP